MFISLLIAGNCILPCIDGVFVFDVSNSIGDVGEEGTEAFNRMKDFMKMTFGLVNISPNCSRAGLILFARNIDIRFNLNEYTDLDSLQKALDNITLESVRRRKGTNTPGVLRLLRTAAKDGSLGLNMNNEDIIQIAIVITDGRPHIQGMIQEVVGNQTRKDGEELRKAEIYEHIYAIGVQGRKDKEVDEDVLKLITGDIESTFLIANFSQQAFEQAAANIRGEFCNNCE